MVELTWRVTNLDGLRWAWSTLAQAQAQIELWRSYGARGTISPVFRRDGMELTPDELAEWFASLSAQSEVGNG